MMGKPTDPNYQRKWRGDNPSRVAEYATRYRLKNPAKILLWSARVRAKKRGLLCTIVEADIVIPSICPVLGIPIFLDLAAHRAAKHPPNSPSLDQIRPGVGYIPGNVRVISWRANELKRNGTLAEMLLVVADLERIQDR